MTVSCESVKKTAEEQIKALFAKHSFPPLEVVIPILEKTGKGEQEVAAQVYDTSLSLANGLKEILGLKDKSMKTLAKLEEVLLGFYGQNYEPIELSESKFSFGISECPMLHVRKDVSSSVKISFVICIVQVEARLSWIPYSVSTEVHVLGIRR